MTVQSNSVVQSAKAVLRSLRVSPIKLNLVVNLIRGKSSDNALNVLTFSKRRIAVDVKKVLLSAIANAENNHGMDIDKLVISEAYVGRGVIMKRWRAKARGRFAPIKKPLSNLTIIVKEKS